MLNRSRSGLPHSPAFFLHPPREGPGLLDWPSETFKGPFWWLEVEDELWLPLWQRRAVSGCSGPAAVPPCNAVACVTPGTVGTGCWLALELGLELRVCTWGPYPRPCN